MKEQIEVITYEQDRLNYFTDLMKKAQERYKRLFKKHKDAPYLSEEAQALSDAGRETHFLGDVVGMLEKGVGKHSEGLANDIANICPDLVESGCGGFSCVACLTRGLEQMGYVEQSEWISVEDRLPESEKIVLASAVSKTFRYRHTLMVAHIGHHEFTTEDTDWREFEGDTEYDEENDCFWIPECWYEVNSVEDNGNWIIDSDYDVTHWMPLPEPPEMKGGAK